MRRRAIRLLSHANYQLDRRSSIRSHDVRKANVLWPMNRVTSSAQWRTCGGILHSPRSGHCWHARKRWVPEQREAVGREARVDGHRCVLAGNCRAQHRFKGVSASEELMAAGMGPGRVGHSKHRAWRGYGRATRLHAALLQFASLKSASTDCLRNGRLASDEGYIVTAFEADFTFEGAVVLATWPSRRPLPSSISSLPQ